MTDVIAVDVGGTKLAAGIVRDRRHTRAPGRHAHPARRRRRRAVCGARRSRRSARRAATRSRWVWAAADRWTAAASTCRRSTSPRGAASPCASGWRRTPRFPVWIDNDAKALALGEGWLGAAVGAPDYIGMVVSTGVGGGIVLDGRLLDGADGNAGHIGHVIVEPDGPRVRVRRTRLPRGRGVGIGHRALHGCAGAAGADRGPGAHRDARGPRGRVGRQPARPPARRGQRFRRARFRRAVLRRRPARDRRELPPRLLAGRPDRARRARRRRPPDRRRPESPSAGF